MIFCDTKIENFKSDSRKHRQQPKFPTKKLCVFIIFYQRPSTNPYDPHGHVSISSAHCRKNLTRTTCTTISMCNWKRGSDNVHQAVAFKCNRRSIRQHQPVCKRKEKMTWLDQYQTIFSNVDAIPSGRRAIGKKHEGVATTGGQMQRNI